MRLRAAIVRAVVAVVLAFWASGREASAQESCANLQYQLQVLRGSGGAGSSWENFIHQRMQQLGCFGPRCPGNSVECGNYCCNEGFYCSRFGCTPQGAVDCGNYYCQPGQQCSRSGGCFPQGVVDCDSYSCQPGQRCGGSHRACLNDGETDCGGHHCGVGMQCARGGRCIPTGKVDCGPGVGYCDEGKKCSQSGKMCLDREDTDCGGYSCGSGQKCASGNRCIARDESDCGGGKSCPAGQKCSRGGGCIDKAAVDCGRGASCARGEKCMPGGGCAPGDAVICRDGKQNRHCPRGTQCVGMSECLTAKQIADREAEKKRLAQEAKREAERKKEEERREALARRQRELEEARRSALERSKGIQAQAAPRGVQNAVGWTPGRMRQARPDPLPIIGPGSIIFRPAPPRVGPPSFLVPPIDAGPGRGQMPAHLAAAPLKWAGKFFFRRPDGDSMCSAQFIAPGIILTAAHCVRDHRSGRYYTSFAFALQYHNGAFTRRYGWKCVATAEEWVQPSDLRYRWDYAMLLADDVSPTGHFGWRSEGTAADERVSKIGYPSEMERGEVMQIDSGPVTLHEDWIELRHGNAMSRGGSSGGAWVTKLQAATGSDVNLAISVTAFGRPDEPGVSYGPYFDERFKRMLDFVANGCK